LQHVDLNLGTFGIIYNSYRKFQIGKCENTIIVVSYVLKF
jgi:hypothetical protein